MTYFFLLPLLVGISSCSHPWSYQTKGSLGPSHWPGTCSQGTAQSPVNLVAAVSQEQPDWKFSNYEAVPNKMVVKNNGHSAKVRIQEEEDIDWPNVEGGGLQGNFRFAQLHFHWGNSSETGSEHQIDSKMFPMEVHMVHYNTRYSDLWEAITHPDGLAVLSVLFNLSDEDNHNLEPIVKNLEKVEQSQVESQLETSFAVKSLLPQDRSAFFRYTGSLTTPDCNEIVTWTVFLSSLTVSESQLSVFRSLVDREGNKMGNNYRPVQPLNGRNIYISGVETVQSSKQLAGPHDGVETVQSSKQQDSPHHDHETSPDMSKDRIDSNKNMTIDYTNKYEDSDDKDDKITTNPESDSDITNIESGNAKSPMAFFILLIPIGCFLREASVRPVNSSGLIRVWITFCICSLFYWALGFGFAFGDGQTSFSGSSYFFGQFVSDYVMPVWVHHFIFSLSTANLVSSSLADKSSQMSLVLHSALICTLIQPIISHWMWHPDGWLASQGVLDAGGSGVIHLTAAACVASGNIMIGTYQQKPTNKLKTLNISNLKLFFFGGILLISGILAINSSFQANIYVSITNTILSVSSAGLTVITIITVLKYFKVSLVDDILVPLVHGSLSGAVAVSSGAVVFSPGAAVCVGCVAGALYLCGDWIFKKLNIKECLETVVIHGSAGLWGLLATTLLSPDGLLICWSYKSAQYSLHGVGWALLAALTISLWAAGCSFVLLGVLRFSGHLTSTKEKHPVIGTKEEMEKINDLDENTIEDVLNKNSV